MTLAVLLLLSLLTSCQEGKLPPPEAGAQKDAENLIREVFKEEYSKKAPADKAALAARMTLQARETKDDAASRYVLFREAQDLFAQAGELEKSFAAIDEISTLYAIDALAMKSAALTLASKTVRLPDEINRLGEAQLKFAGDVAQADHYEAAEKAIQAALAAARRTTNSGLATRAATKGKEIADLKSRYDKLKKARETLASSPDDAAANFAVGQFQAVVKGHWEAGLPLLAKGSDAGHRAAAEKDLAAPKEASDQAVAGDSWWDLSEKESGTAKDNLRARAIVWYERAVKQPKLAGLARTKAEKRLFDGRMEQVNRGTWTDISDPKLWGKTQAPIELSDGSPSAILVKLPAGSFDGVTVRARIKTPDPVFNVQYEPGIRAMEMQPVSGMFAPTRLEANTWQRDLTLYGAKKEEYVLTMLIADGEYRYYLDGREMGRVKSVTDKLPGLKLYVFSGRVQFDQIRIRKKE